MCNRFCSQEHGTSSTDFCHLSIIIVCIYTSFYLQSKGKWCFPKPRKILLQSGFYVKYIPVVCKFILISLPHWKIFNYVRIKMHLFVFSLYIYKKKSCSNSNCYLYKILLFRRILACITEERNITNLWLCAFNAVFQKPFSPFPQSMHTAFF